MTRRTEFTRTTKLAAWDRSGGKCEEPECAHKIFPGDGPEYDHRIPAEQGGDNSLGNCQVLCIPCHKAKTRDDMKVISKSRSVRARHVGASKPRKIMDGSRDSDWKHTVNHGWVRR